MSLINEALKKTQQARASVQGEGSLMHSDAGAHTTLTPKASPWPWIFGMVALIVISIPLSIWLLNSEPKPEQEITELAVDPIEEKAPEIIPEDLPETPPIEEDHSATEPSETAVSETPEPETIAPAPTEETDTPAPEAQEEAEPISANPEIIELLKTVTVTGLLLSNDPKESKVLLDGDVYSVNAVIDSQLGCRIAEIKQNAVVFTDESGVRYTKRF
ncbi:MAG: hypothetical protein AAF212_08480 [Verrucomicrobiota bacterium]